MTEHEMSAVPREARPFQGESAGVVTRFVANTIDAVVVGIALGVMYAGVAAVVFILDPREFTFPAAGVLLSLTAALSTSTAYLALAWWLAGKTYGDHVMGLRVVGRRGRRLGPLRSLMRAAWCVFFPIGLFWCVVSPERRSVQDIVLWTRVVYDWLPADRHPAHEHEHGHEHGHGHGHPHGSAHPDGHGLDGREHRGHDAGPAASGDAPFQHGATGPGHPPPPDRSDTRGKAR